MFPRYTWCLKRPMWYKSREMYSALIRVQVMSFGRGVVYIQNPLELLECSEKTDNSFKSKNVCFDISAHKIGDNFDC